MHKHEAISQFESSSRAVKVAVVGARGYSGLELCRWLLSHPMAELAGCFATDHSFALKNSLFEKAAAAVPTWLIGEFESRLEGLHTVFLATPAEVSLELAPKALKRGVNVIDLSGAYRLQAGSDETVLGNYRKWYGLELTDLGTFRKAEYGLVPWVSESAAVSGEPRLISNPGCYASAVLMGLLPLLKAQAVLPETLVIDAKSGTSGAGRKAAENLLFTEVDGECLPYKVAKHQHWPEIVEACGKFAQTAVDPFFTTHLLNVRRGIIASMYGRLSANFVAATNSETERKIEGLFHETYGSYPLVRFGSLGKAESDGLLMLKRVVGSARTHVSFKSDGNKIFIFSTLDNLVKGAAGQAIENFNRLLGQHFELGLIDKEGTL